MRASATVDAPVLDSSSLRSSASPKLEEDAMTRRVQLLLGGMLVLAACSSGTKITRTWTGRDPTLGLKPGDLVAVGVMTTNEREGKAGEEVLATEMRARGYRTVRATSLLHWPELPDIPGALAAFRKSGATAAFVVRPLGVDHQATALPPTVMNTPMSPIGGESASSRGSGNYVPGYVRTDTVVRLSAMVFDLSDGRLVWSGQSETMNPDRLDHLISSLVRAAEAEMARSGVKLATR
jgi:hypothetical protein